MPSRDLRMHRDFTVWLTRAWEPGVIFVTSILVLATIAVAALVIVPRLSPGRVVFSLVPDRPYPFGYKMAWLAIRSDDTARGWNAWAFAMRDREPGIGPRHDL